MTPKTSYQDITTYNNYYELGVSKSEPANLGFRIKSRPWTLRITGEVEQERSLDIDTLIRWFGLEERVYRMRCVEAWSMVIPWLGFPAGRRGEEAQPDVSRQIRALHDPARSRAAAESRKPRVALAVRGRLTHRRGHEPARVFWPSACTARRCWARTARPCAWSCPGNTAFKGGKSLVEIRFQEREPATTWSSAAPAEYGFYANVNPEVDHPRWSQASERRIGELSRRKTLPFNGYAEQVADFVSRHGPRAVFLSGKVEALLAGPPRRLLAPCCRFASIAWRLSRQRLGANPIATALNQIGLLSLIFLCASLSCTPLKIAFGWHWPLRVRRTLGLCAFFSASLHFLVYLVLDQSLALGAVLADVLKRPFIALGFGAFGFARAACAHLQQARAGTPGLSALAAPPPFGLWGWDLGRAALLSTGEGGFTHSPSHTGLVLALGFALRGAAKLKKSRDTRLRANLGGARSESA